MLSKEGYVLVTQVGPVTIAHIKSARADSLPLYDNGDRALVDFRLADLSGLSVLDLDNLGIEFRQDVPKCKRMAIVRIPKVDDSDYTHLANTHSICGVNTQLFEHMDAARTWLLKVG